MHRDVTAFRSTRYRQRTSPTANTPMRTSVAATSTAPSVLPRSRKTPSNNLLSPSHHFSPTNAARQRMCRPSRDTHSWGHSPARTTPPPSRTVLPQSRYRSPRGGTGMSSTMHTSSRPRLMSAASFLSASSATASSASASTLYFMRGRTSSTAVCRCWKRSMACCRRAQSMPSRCPRSCGR